MNKLVVAICALLSASLWVSIATAASESESGAPSTSAERSFTWTEAKAARVVVKDARVQLAPSEQSALEQELRGAMLLYQLLVVDAESVGDMQAAARYNSLASRYSTAWWNVRVGLGVANAECRGSSQSAKGGRFNRFLCSATSESLDIPSVTLVPAPDGEMPAVVEGEARTLGPVQARLSVRVTGRSTIGYRQIVVE